MNSLYSLIICRHIKGKGVLVVTNTKVAPLYLDKVIHALIVGNPNVSVESIILPDGEQYKNMVITFTKKLSLFSHVLVGNS